MKKLILLFVLLAIFFVGTSQKIVRLNYFNYPINTNFEGITINVNKQYETKNLTVYIYTCVNKTTLNPNDSLIGYFTLNSDTVFRYKCKINNIVNQGDTLETGCVLSVKTSAFKEGNNTICCRFHKLYKNGVPYELTDEACCPTFTVTTSNTTNEIIFSESNIYPIPAKDILTIINYTNADLYLYTISGQLVKSKKNMDSYSTLDISNLANGIYFLKIINNQAIITKKIHIDK